MSGHRFIGDHAGQRDYRGNLLPVAPVPADPVDEVPLLPPTDGDQSEDGDHDDADQSEDDASTD